MSKRYITRGNSGESNNLFISRKESDYTCSYDNSETKYKEFDTNYSHFNYSFNEIILIMKELYKYRDVIDYGSFIVAISKKYYVKHRLIEEVGTIGCQYNIIIHKIIREEYIDDEIMNDYNDKIYEKITDTHIDNLNNHRIVALLLVDKNKNIYKINVSDEFIKYIHTRYCGGEYNEFNIIPIGEIIYYIDIMYYPEKNCFYNDNECKYTIPRDYLLFISKKPPSYKDYVKIDGSKEADDVIYYINNHKEEIYRNLGIEIEDKRIEFKYIDDKAARKNAINKRKKQLMKELTELDNEYNDDLNNK